MLPFPYTHAWSRLQKPLIVAATCVTFAAVLGLAYGHARSHRLPDANILVGTWEMTSPHDGDSSFFLFLLPESAAGRGGVWVRSDSAGGTPGFSDMVWFAGGSYIYMHFTEEPMQIWEIIGVGSDQLRLRHAKRDYVFKRLPDEGI